MTVVGRGMPPEDAQRQVRGEHEGREIIIALLGSRDLWGDAKKLLEIGYGDTLPPEAPSLLQRARRTSRAERVASQRLVWRGEIALARPILTRLLAEAETAVSADGSESVTSTPVAVFGPRFSTDQARSCAGHSREDLLRQLPRGEGVREIAVLPDVGELGAGGR